MPAPLNVNREAVKTLAIAIGVRQAAREMGLDEKTVLGWSHREGWFKGEMRQPSINGCASVKSPEVKPASQALTDSLARLGEETKHNLAKAGHKASKHLAKLQGAKITGQSSDFKNIVGANAQLHGWDTRFQGTQFSLNVLNLGDGNVQIGAVREDQSEQQADARDV